LKLSPDYRSAVAAWSKQRTEAEDAAKSVKQLTEQLSQARAEGDKRWAAMRWKWMGFGHMAHQLGVAKDHRLSQSEASEASAAKDLPLAEQRRAAATSDLASAEKAATAAFEHIRPKAEADVRSAQERMEVAKEVLTERADARKAEVEMAEKVRAARVASLTPQQRKTNDALIASLERRYFAAPEGSIEEAGAQAMYEKAQELAADGRAVDEHRKELVEAGRAAQHEHEPVRDRGQDLGH
jgi:hypothetical protein